MEEDSRLNCLPSEIKLNILSRLPAELVLDCKRVCRAWRDLIQSHVNTNYFADLHLQCQQGTHSSDTAMMSFVSCFDERDLYYAEYYDDYKKNSKLAHYSTRRINLKLQVNYVVLVGSCNGLICFEGMEIHNKPTIGYYSYVESFYICNPIMGEILNLPGRCDHTKDIIHGFGYQPLTNEYKVVRISYDGDKYQIKPPYKGHVEVYTLGSGTGWRSKGETKIRLLPNTEAGSICVNGALHWLQKGSEDIVAFDLADEKFHLLQSPPKQKRNKKPRVYTDRRLGILEGCLVVIVEFRDDGIWLWHLWFLKKNNEENSSDNKEIYAEDFCWNRKYIMQVKSLTENPGLFEWPALLALVEGDQALLMYQDLGNVFRYNLRKSQISDEIWAPYEKHRWAVPIPHRNSFVSLKALGEQNVKCLTRVENGNCWRRKF